MQIGETLKVGLCDHRRNLIDAVEADLSLAMAGEDFLLQLENGSFLYKWSLPALKHTRYPGRTADKGLPEITLTHKRAWGVLTLYRQT